MKNFVLFFLLSFSIEGVFGGESVSVTDGDSVTFHTGLTEIKEGDVLDWWFGAGDGRDRIARVRKDTSSIFDDDLNGRFRDRLKLDNPTGDLTITNIRNEHAGPYDISNTTHTLRTFTVNVVPAGPVKTVSMMVGDSVTLHTGVPEPQRYDVMQWRSEHLNPSIAKINRKTRNYFTSNTDGRFKDRLQLDCWTGSLTIMNTRTTDSGEYEVDMSSSNHNIHKSFTLSVSGEIKSVLSVMKEDTVTLNTGLTKIQTDDLMQWMFGYTQIAEINKTGDRFSTSDDPDGRRKLDNQTGSLTITNTTFTDSGEYELKISNSRRTVHKRFTVTVTFIASPTLPSCATNWRNSFSGVAAAAVAVAAVVVLYQWYRISKLKKQASKTDIKIMPVKKGEFVTLETGVIYIFKSEDSSIKLFKVKVLDLTDNRYNPKKKSVTKNNPEEVSLTSVDSAL